MNADADQDASALVPRPLSTVEQTEPGARRVLASMVSDTLGIARRTMPQTTTTSARGEVENWCRLGAEAFGIKDFANAAKLYRMAAERGDADAQFRLGICCIKGRLSDASLPIGWWRKAGEQGHAEAQFALGSYYEHCARPPDAKEAAKWYCRAAEKGDTVSQIRIASCYEIGSGVLQDEAEAVKWYRRAAEQGAVIGMDYLGCCYVEGKGVPTDLVEAHKWFRVAAELEGTSGSETLASVAALLSAQELQEAGRRYDEFKATQRTGANVPEPLTKEQYEQPRTPQDLMRFVENALGEAQQSPESLESAMLGHGLYKNLRREAYPLAVFGLWKYPGADVLCAPLLGNQGYDAKLMTINGTHICNVEVGWPIDGQTENQRAKDLFARGCTSVWGGDPARSRQADIERLIDGARRKAEKDYSDAILLMVIDLSDSFFRDDPGSEQDLRTLLQRMASIRQIARETYLVLLPIEYMKFHGLHEVMELKQGGRGDRETKSLRPQSAEQSSHAGREDKSSPTV